MNTHNEKHTIEVISCQRFEQFIVDFLDNKLPQHQKIIFIKHLTECAKCEVYLSNYRKSIELSQSAFVNEDASKEEQIPEELVQAILAASKKNNL